MIEGENGTGKSSLLKACAGLIASPDASSTYSGYNINQVKPKEFSFLTTTSLGLLNNLTGREHIKLISSGLSVRSEVLAAKILEYQKIEIFNEVLDKQVSDYSQGMKQLLRLFLHLFFEPRLLFLDEPFLYLSPSLKKIVQNKIEAISLGSIVLITDQQFTWSPAVKTDKIRLGLK